MDNKKLLPRGLVALQPERRAHPLQNDGEQQTNVQHRMPFFEVVGMSVGIASSDIVRGRSTVAVENRKQVTSAAMGISRPSEGRCLSCWNDFIECPGHLGFMDTPCYIHPLAVNAVAQLMTIVCHRCHTPLISSDLVRTAVAADLLPEPMFTGILRSLASHHHHHQPTPPAVAGGTSRLRHLVDFVRKSTACSNCNAPVFLADVRNGHDVALVVDGMPILLPPSYIRFVLG